MDTPDDNCVDLGNLEDWLAQTPAAAEFAAAPKKAAKPLKKGPQDTGPASPREWRKMASDLLTHKAGLTSAQKLEQLKLARTALDNAIKAMEGGN